MQIQLNYLDWKYAKQINPMNTDAEYLYNELNKPGIPAVIMEPLLGDRLSNVPGNIVARLKQRELEMSVASWAFRFAASHFKRASLILLGGVVLAYQFIGTLGEWAMNGGLFPRYSGFSYRSARNAGTDHRRLAYY